LVGPGDRVVPGMAILECTPDAEFVEVGRLDDGKSGKVDRGSIPGRLDSVEPFWKEQGAGPSAPRPAGDQMNAKTVGPLLYPRRSAAARRSPASGG
jgi:hypothetical protein